MNCNGKSELQIVIVKGTVEPVSVEKMQKNEQNGNDVERWKGRSRKERQQENHVTNYGMQKN